MYILFKENIISISLYRVQKKFDQWTFICIILITRTLISPLSVR